MPAGPRLPDQTDSCERSSAQSLSSALWTGGAFRNRCSDGPHDYLPMLARRSWRTLDAPCQQPVTEIAVNTPESASKSMACS